MVQQIILPLCLCKPSARIGLTPLTEGDDKTTMGSMASSPSLVRWPDVPAPRGRKWSEVKGSIGAGIAESDFGTAPNITSALHRAVSEGFLTYLPDELAEEAAAACAHLYRDRTGWQPEPEMMRLVPDVLTGLAAMLELTPGSGPIVIPTPCYSPFLSVPTQAKRPVVFVPSSGSQWTDLERIDTALAAPESVLLLCNPHNPLGTVQSREWLARLADIVEYRRAHVFVDEIHAPVVYPGNTHVPYASVSDAAAAHSMTAISPSKGWNVAGLKSAHMVITNPDDRKRWDALGRFPARSGSPLGALAIVAAYSADGLEWLDRTIAQLDRNRMLLTQLLAERLPLVTFRPPAGTYLAWLGFERYRLPERSAADFVLQRAGIAVVDGASCGAGAEQHVRFNFAMRPDLFEVAVDSLARALEHCDTREEPQ